MKTTKGKTKSVRPKRRSVRIHTQPDGLRVACRWAPTLKQGLEEFFKADLEPKGWKKVKIIGNVLTCEKGTEVKNWLCIEEYQSV